MKILTIIVSYNFMAWAQRCLDSLRASSVRSDVLVVDNGSGDGSVAFIRENYPEVRLIENTSNDGFGAANNIGLRIACEEGYDYVYLLNQDAWLETDTLERLLAADDGKVGLLSPVQRSASGDLDPNFRRKCGRYLEKCHSEIVEVPFVMAAHWFLPRRAFTAVGGFSPVFRQYGEDDNYIDRLHYHGFRAVVVKSASAVHDRALRPEPREKRLRLKCIACVVRLSNPNKPFWLQLPLQMLMLVGMSVKNLSLVPLRFIPEFAKKSTSVRCSRKESMKPGAFCQLP